MKVTMLSVMCGPEGNASQGTVLDIPDKIMTTITDEETNKEIEVPFAKYLIDKKYARAFDPEKDRKNKRGLVKAEK